MSAAAAPSTITAGQVADWLRLFIEPGQVTQLRALKVKQGWGGKRTIAGYFDYAHLDQMAEAALELEQAARGVYFVFNPLDPSILARCANRIDVAEEDGLSKVPHITGR